MAWEYLDKNPPPVMDEMCVCRECNGTGIKREIRHYQTQDEREAWRRGFITWRRYQHDKHGTYSRAGYELLYRWLRKRGGVATAKEMDKLNSERIGGYYPYGAMIWNDEFIPTKKGGVHHEYSIRKLNDIGDVNRDALKQLNTPQDVLLFILSQIIKEKSRYENR